jgi:hypothetical protein
VRKKKKDVRGQRDHEHLQCEPCQAAAVGKKRKEKEYMTMNTYSENRVRRRLWGRERKRKSSEVNATMNTCSVNRVRRRLRGRKEKERKGVYFCDANATMNTIE